MQMVTNLLGRKVKVNGKIGELVLIIVPNSYDESLSLSTEYIVLLPDKNGDKKLSLYGRNQLVFI